MKKIFTTHIRPINLVFLVLIQWMLAYFLSENPLSDQNILHVLCISIATVFSAAGGYLINDLYDEKADTVNKEDYTGISEDNKGKYRRIYYLINVMALVAAAVTMSVYFVLLTLINQFLLSLYSRKLKHVVFWDNLLVAVISASSLASIYFAGFPLNSSVLNFFIGFSLLGTLIRELVKDIEDMEGDQAAGYRSYPTEHGIAPTKRLISLISVAVTLLMLWFVYYLLSVLHIWATIWFVGFSLIPFAGLWYFIAYARTKKHYYQISQYIKLHMLTSLLTVIFTSYR